LITGGTTVVVAFHCPCWPAGMCGGTFNVVVAGNTIDVGVIGAWPCGVIGGWPGGVIGGGTGGWPSGVLSHVVGGSPAGVPGTNIDVGVRG
jgi:hypothetical protein